MERAALGAERTRTACQPFGNLALDLERGPAAMATAGNGHNDDPFDMEISGLGDDRRSRWLRNRS